MTKENISQLLQSLEEASGTYRTDAREGCVKVLVATLNFLKAIDCQPELRQPLYGLLGALDDAKRGVSNPLTTPGEHPGGSPKPIKEMLDKARAAAAVSLMMADGKSLDEALNMVVGPAGSASERRALLEFRKNLNRGRAPEEAIDFYRLVLNRARASGLSARDAAAAALSYVKA